MRSPEVPPGAVGGVAENVAKAAAAFESHWTLEALRRVDAELCERLQAQRAYFHEALFEGEKENIKIQGEALCRGWQAAAAAMMAAAVPPDAYMLGQHGGTVVAIGLACDARSRVREVGGQPVVWLTPDEVAAMFAGAQCLATVKELWPDSQVVRVVDKYPDEPAKED